MKKLVLILVALMVVGSFLVACSKEKKVSEIRIGMVDAQTGMFAAFGQAGIFGAKAAVDDINKLGGIT